MKNYQYYFFSIIIKFIHKIRISLIIFITLMACSKSSDKYDIVLNNNTTLITSFPKEQNISFKNLFEYTKGDPRSIHYKDSILIIANKSRNSNYFFYKYSLINKILSKGFLRKGRGPSEAIGISVTGIDNNILWAYDVTLKRVFTTDLANTLKNKSLISFNTYPIKNQYFKMVYMDSLKVLAISLDGKTSSRLDIIDLNSDKKIMEFGSFYKIPTEMPIGSIKDAYAAEIFLKPTKDKFVLAYNFTDIMEIFNLKTNKSFAIQGPDNFAVNFKVKNKKDFYYMGTTSETRNGFSNGVVTNEYIYLLYSGYKREGRSEDVRFKWNHAKFIYVYDWNGNPVKKINLDRYVSAIGVSADNKTIYSYDPKTGYIIIAKLNVK